MHILQFKPLRYESIGDNNDYNNNTRLNNGYKMMT